MLNEHPFQAELMVSLNDVTLNGYIAAPPERQLVKNGTSWKVTFPLQFVQKSTHPPYGSPVFAPCWVTTFCPENDYCLQLQEGEPVIVQGTLQVHQWQAQSGEFKQELRVTARAIDNFLPHSYRELKAQTIRQRAL